MAIQPGGRGPFYPLTFHFQKAALMDSEQRIRFEQVFGKAPAISASAPGRVNLIGDHTDYNGGFVFPSAIPQRTSVLIGPRDDDRVRVVSASVESEKPLEYQLGGEQPGRGWLVRARRAWQNGGDLAVFQSRSDFNDGSRGLQPTVPGRTSRASRSDA